MNTRDHALFLLAQRYHKRDQKKGTVKHWYAIRKGPKNRKYVCHICGAAVCSEASNNPKSLLSEELLDAHGLNHLRERGLEDFA